MVNGYITMANSYTDDIKVKISEKYKPPFRISMPMTYSQRLTLNKQIQDTRPTYDFRLEKSVLEKMQQWKNFRKNQEEERKERLDLARKEFYERIEKEREENEHFEAKLLEQANQSQNYPKTTLNQNYITNNGILMPTPVSTYSDNILTTIPLQSNFESQRNVKPFNLSDFEADTSSPFDNMELKSINDMEELAQVLKSDRNTTFSMYSNTNSQIPTNYGQTSQSYSQIPGNSQDSTGYTQIPNTYSQVNMNFNQVSSSYSPYVNQFNVSNSIAYNVPTATSNYSNLNGYYYNTAVANTQKSLSHSSTAYSPYTSTITQPSMQKTSCKSVPDLVKSLEKELENSHIQSDPKSLNKISATQSFKTTNVQIPTRPKSTDSVHPKVKVKQDIFNPFDKLSRDQKETCRNVSSMGFPLDRVARVCTVVGNDQKKILDHLLALSDLLDLGFSEKDASEALIKNDNDRDKALDLLIS